MGRPLSFLVSVLIRPPLLSLDMNYHSHLSSGSLEQAGHVDFYPNGGMNQPSCGQVTAKAIHAILNLGPLDVIGPMNIQGQCHI